MIRRSIFLYLAFMAVIIIVSGQNENAWRLCQSLGAICQTDVDCCSDNCVDGRCCGRSGDKGCQLGAGYDGAGGCCPRHYCEYLESTGQTQCMPTI